MRLPLLFLLLTLTLGCVAVPKSYIQAKDLSYNQEPVLEPWLENIGFEFNVFNLEFSECLGKVTGQLSNSYDFVIQLNETGKVEAIFSLDKSDSQICINQAIKTQQFSVPPISPAFLMVSINLKVPPKSNSDEVFIKDVLN